MKKVALFFALALAACSSDSNDPKVAITVLNDVVQPVVPGDIITLSATTANIGSPTFTWAVLGETVAGATGAQVSIRITDQITEPTTLEITVTATGSNENNGTAKATATVKFQAQPGTKTNAVPVAIADTYSIGANGTLTASVSVLANDIDDAYFGTLLRAVIVDTTAHGLLVLNSNGTFSYKPTTDYVGVDTFRYRATDGLLASDPVTVTITVTDTNAAPVAVADTYTIAGNTTLSATRSVLANDTDDNFGGTTLQATLVDDVSHGTLVLSPNGTFTYTPDNDNFADATFTYVATDGALTSDLTTVTISITSVNAAPVAVTDEAAVGKNGTLTVTLAQSILLNDEDDNFGGSTLTAVLDQNVSHGTLVLNANGSFTYAPAHDYIGLDTFTYHAFDGERSSNVVAVNITVNDANQPPTAVADTYTVAKNKTLTVGTRDAGVLSNDTDDHFDGTTMLTVTNLTQPATGTLVLNAADGTFTYTPAHNSTTTATFNYTANDGSLESATVTVTITVTNTAPVALNDSYTIAEDNTLTVAAPGVIANDTDDNGDTVIAVLVAGPLHGTLTLNVSGSFTYAPSANYNGPDSFAYRVSDGTANSNSATVSLTVTPVNDAPTGPDLTYHFTPNTPLTVAAPGVLTAVTDIDGDTITAVPANLSLGGTTFVLASDGSFTFSPGSGLATASVGFQFTDGTATTNAVIMFTTP